jgi:hypothetical protein
MTENNPIPESSRFVESKYTADSNNTEMPEIQLRKVSGAHQMQRGEETGMN